MTMTIDELWAYLRQHGYTKKMKLTTGTWLLDGPDGQPYTLSGHETYSLEQRFTLAVGFAQQHGLPLPVIKH